MGELPVQQRRNRIITFTIERRKYEDQHTQHDPPNDERGILLGLVLLDNIRNIMFRPELYNRFHVSKFMVSAPAKIQVGTPMEQIMRIFDDTKAWNLPVVDEEGRYIGFMSKSKIFNSYREVLVENFSGD